VPAVPKMLMDLCFRGLGVARDDAGLAACIKVLFDRDEPFIRHMKSSWQAGRKALRRAGKDGWPLQIGEVEPAGSADHPGLQIADLLSWTIRCRYEYGDKMIDPKIAMIMLQFLMAGRLRGGFLDSDAVHAFYVEKRVLEFAHNYAFA
jgi:hypothetical protein